MDPGADDPDQPGLAFARVPSAVRVNGRFEVWVRVNDDRGVRRVGIFPDITISAAGKGTLRGTLTRPAMAGMAVFDDLSYDVWEPIRLTVRANGFADATTRASFPVRPVMRFVQMPPVHVPAKTALGAIQVELVDGRGKAVPSDHPVTLEVIGGPTTPGPGGATRSFAGGPASFEGLTLETPGHRTLIWKSPDLLDLVHGLTVHDGQQHESTWLPGGRVGVPYWAQIPGDAVEYQIVRGTLPRGLTLEDGGEIHGVPATAQQVQLEVFAAGPGTRSARWSLSFSIFPAVEAAPAASVDELDVEGRFPVTMLEESVPVASRKVTAALRLFAPLPPADSDPTVAARSYPLVVFHHGGLPLDAARPRSFDRFDHLLRRWASHGFVVASVEATDLVWNRGRLVSATLTNMNLMSENQRAAIAFLRARNGDPTWPLHGRIDADRVIVAGHSRGGAASLITAAAEPSVIGGILIKPLDPMATVGGEQVWRRDLPAKPFLVIAGGNDGDLPYPMVDFLYERRAGPMTMVTILGSVHNFSCDTCPVEPNVSAEIGRDRDWAVTNAYAVAFLRYLGGQGLSQAPLLFGPAALSTRLSPLGVLVRADRRLRARPVDDFQDQLVGRNQLGLRSDEEGLIWSAEEPSLAGPGLALPDGYEFYRGLLQRPDVQERCRAQRIEWDRPGAVWRTDLGALDARAFASFVFRARTDRETIEGDRLALRFHDSEGNVAIIQGAGRAGDRGIGGRFSDVIVPVEAIRSAGVDVAVLERVELVMWGAAGAVFIDDLRFE
jgi:hypothetical protein